MREFSFFRRYPEIRTASKEGRKLFERRRRRGIAAGARERRRELAELSRAEIYNRTRTESFFFPFVLLRILPFVRKPNGRMSEECGKEVPEEPLSVITVRLTLEKNFPPKGKRTNASIYYHYISIKYLNKKILRFIYVLYLLTAMLALWPNAVNKL